MSTCTEQEGSCCGYCSYEKEVEAIDRKQWFWFIREWGSFLLKYFTFNACKMKNLNLLLLPKQTKGRLPHQSLNLRPTELVQLLEWVWVERIWVVPQIFERVQLNLILTCSLCTVCRSPNFANSCWLNKHVCWLGLHVTGGFFYNSYSS